jgi:hypothetical protein
MVCFDVGLNVGTGAMSAMSAALIRDGGVKSVHDHAKGLAISSMYIGSWWGNHVCLGNAATLPVPKYSRKMSIMIPDKPLTSC